MELSHCNLRADLDDVGAPPCPFFWDRVGLKNLTRDVILSKSAQAVREVEGPAFAGNRLPATLIPL